MREARTLPPAAGRPRSRFAVAAALLHLSRGLLAQSRAALALLGLTMGLAALLASAGAQVWRGTPAGYEALHASTGAPHAWFLLPQHPLRETAAAVVAADPAVAAQAIVAPVATVSMLVEQEGAARAVDVRAYGWPPGGAVHSTLGGAGGAAGAEGGGAFGGMGGGADGAANGPLAGFALLEGRWPAAGSPEVVLDAGLAAALGLPAGADVRLVGRDGPVAVRIVGLAASALHCPYPDCAPAPAVVPAELLAQLSAAPHMLLGVRLHDPQAAPAFVFAARRRAAAYGVLAEGGNWRDLVAQQQLTASLSAGFLVLGGGLSLLAGAAVSAHVVAAAAVAGRRVMGLGRAVGFTPRQVVAAFALGCGAVGAAAGAAGSPVGWLAARAWLAAGSAWTAAAAGGAGAVPAWDWTPGIVALAVAVVAAATGARAARGVAWASPGAAVAGAGGSVPVRLNLGRLGARPFILLWPVRPLVPALAVAISMTVGTGALVLAGTLAAFSRDPAQLGVFHQLTVERNGLDPSAVDRIVEAVPGVAGFHREGWLRVDVPEAAESIIVRGLDGDWRELPWRVLAGRFIQEPGEIALGTSAMERLGVQPGDHVEVVLGQRRARWRVAGAYLELANYGLAGAVAWETLADLQPAAQPAAWLVRLDRAADAGTVRALLLEAGGGGIAVSAAGFEPPAAVRTAGRLVGGLSLLLAGVAAVAVVQGMAAAVREQRRDIAILKAIGMTPGQLVAGAVTGVVAATAPGSGVGAVAGLLLSEIGFRIASAMTGIGGLAPVQPWALVAALTAAAPLAAGLAALPPALAAARARATELGGEEI